MTNCIHNSAYYFINAGFINVQFILMLQFLLAFEIWMHRKNAHIFSEFYNFLKILFIAPPFSKLHPLTMVHKKINEKCSNGKPSTNSEKLKSSS